MKVKAIQTGNLSFEIDQYGHKYTVDASPENGGQNKGPTPKDLLLGALMGCSGMDIASILNKMHVDYEEFTINSEAVNTDDHPKIYKEIFLEYHIKGSDDLDVSKINRAVELSMTKYCGVSAMLKKNSPIHYKTYLNDRLIHEE